MVLERLLVEPRDAVEEVDLLERVVRVRDLHLEDADELRPLARRLVDRLEHRGGAERILVAALDAFEGDERRRVIDLTLEDLAIELDRARRRRRGASRRAPRSGTGS